MKSIEMRIAELKERRKKEKETHEIFLRTIGSQIRDIQMECDHPETEWHEDASGNNDTWDTCLICGADSYDREVWYHPK